MIVRRPGLGHRDESDPLSRANGQSLDNNLINSQEDADENLPIPLGDVRRPAAL